MKRFPDYVLLVLVAGSLSLLFLSARGFFDPVKAGLRPLRAYSYWKSANPPSGLLQNGDLIFRHGRGFVSNAFRQLSLRDHRYSHAGIVHLEQGKVFIYHCIGGEENLSNKMRKESLEEFCKPEFVHSFGIYRTDLDASALNTLDAEVGELYKKGLEFDMDFDMKTDGKMYCTEMIYKELIKVSGDKNFLPLTKFSGKTYASCDNIYLSPHCRKIYAYSYSN